MRNIKKPLFFRVLLKPKILFQILVKATVFFAIGGIILQVLGSVPALIYIFCSVLLKIFLTENKRYNLRCQTPQEQDEASCIKIHKKKFSSGFVKVYLILGAVGIVLILSFTYVKDILIYQYDFAYEENLHESEPFTVRNDAVQPQKLKEKYSEDSKTDEVIKRGIEQNNAIHEEYLRLTESKTAQYFTKAEDGISAAVDEACGLSFCARYCLLMAKDFLCKTDDAPCMMMEILEREIQKPCDDARRAAEEELKKYHLKLIENENQTKRELGQEFSTKISLAPLPLGNMAVHDLKASLHDTNDTEMSIAFNSIITPALELPFVTATCAAVKKVFAISASKIAETTAVAGYCAASDGPMPIGDIIGSVIGVGGTIWSISDFLEARKDLPEVIEAQLTNSLTEYRNNLRRSTELTSEALFENFNARLTSLGENADKMQKAKR